MNIEDNIKIQQALYKHELNMQPLRKKGRKRLRKRLTPH